MCCACGLSVDVASWCSGVLHVPLASMFHLSKLWVTIETGLSMTCALNVLECYVELY